MIKEAFLICALALPAPEIHFRGSWDNFTAKAFLHQYFLLKRYLTQYDKERHETGEYIVIPSYIIHLIPKGYEKLPSMWGTHIIYRRAA
jgi:hypothetical protein